MAFPVDGDTSASMSDVNIHINAFRAPDAKRTVLSIVKLAIFSEIYEPFQCNSPAKVLELTSLCVTWWFKRKRFRESRRSIAL